MKTKIVISTIIYFLTLTQLHAQSNYSEDIKIPKNAKKLSKSEVLSYSEKNFKTKYNINDNKNTYKIDNILVGYEDYISPKDEKRTLVQIKKEMEEMMGELNIKNNIIKSEIILINNNEYFIWQTFWNDEYVYTLISDTTNKKSIIAKMLFKKVDKKKADRVFNDFIKGIDLKK